MFESVHLIVNGGEQVFEGGPCFSYCSNTKVNGIVIFLVDKRSSPEK